MDTLTHLFDWLMSATVRASWLTLAVLLVQLLLRCRTSARWIYALWLPVLIVLLTPTFPESSLSIGSMLAPENAPMPKADVIAPQQASVDLITPKPEIPSTVNWHQVMLFTWLTGAVGAVILGSVSFVETMRQIKQTRIPVSDAWLNEIDRLAHEIGLRRSPRVWMAAAIRSPAVTGFLRPTLLLPANFTESLTPHEARLVLKHELTHIKRSDLPLNALLCFLLALHWFNPLLWFAFFKARLDREAACDAQLLETESQAQRIAYGHTLLKVETAFSHHGLSLGFVGIFQRGAALRSRIQSIAAPARTRPFASLLATLCILGMTFFGITRAATEDKNAPQIYLTARFIEINGTKNVPDDCDKALLEALADLPSGKNKAGKLEIVLDDPHYQLLLRRLSSRKGVDIMATPSVITRSGQKATIEVAREFTPQDKKPLEKKVGVMLALLPTLTKVGQIKLTLNPRIVEFEGFKKDAKGKDEPIFNERKADASLTLKPGQTVLLDLGSRPDTQSVEDISGGKTVHYTNRITRRAIVLVTAQVMIGQQADPPAQQ
jgi:bla regulator protein blaR1